MRFPFHFLSGLCCLLLIAGCTATDPDVAQTPEPAPAPTPEIRQEKKTERSQHDLNEILDKMSLDQKIGQVVMVSIDQKEMDDSLSQWLAEYQIGNVILTENSLDNAQQASKLNCQLQKAILSTTHVPALLSVRQEGGDHCSLSHGVTVFPSNMAIASAQPQDLYPYAWAMSQQLKDMGFNMNLAPILNPVREPDSLLDPERSFGEDPETAARYGGIWIRGLQENGVICSAGYFPAYGNSFSDQGLLVSECTMDQLMDTGLVPFREAVHNGVSTVLVSSALFPSLDEQFPAALSEKILKGLLRTEMGYEGVILTDCLQDPALTEVYGMEQTALQALNAGVDLLIIKNEESVTSVIQALHQAVHEGTLSPEVLDEAVMNVLRLKNRNGLFDTDPDQYHAPYQQELEEHQTLVQDLYDHSLTLIRDEAALLPLPTESNLFVSFPSAYDLEYGYCSFCDVAMDHLYGKPVTVHQDPTHAEIEEVLFRSDNYDTAIVLVNDIRHNPGQRVLLDRLLEKEMPVVVICTGTPYDVNELEDIGTLFCTYGYTPSSAQSAISLMNGTLTPRGILPVPLR